MESQGLLERDEQGWWRKVAPPPRADDTDPAAMLTSKPFSTL
jgi:hypothetical protein